MTLITSRLKQYLVTHEGATEFSGLGALTYIRTLTSCMRGCVEGGRL